MIRKTDGQEEITCARLFLRFDKEEQAKSRKIMAGRGNLDMSGHVYGGTGSHK